MPFCLKLRKTLLSWKKALEALKKAQDECLRSGFSSQAEEDLEKARKALQSAKERYQKEKEQSFVEVEFIDFNGVQRKEKLFGPEYEALNQLYRECGMEFLEKGTINIEKGHLVYLYLSGLAQEGESREKIEQRTKAFQQIKRFPYLEKLYVQHDNLLSLDVSRNVRLRKFWAENNLLSSLSLMPLPGPLESFDIHRNFLPLDECAQTQEKLMKRLRKANLEIFPQYPPALLKFLENLPSGLSMEEAVERTRKFCAKSPKIKKELVQGKVIIPEDTQEEQALSNLVQKFLARKSQEEKQG